jgi:hypothetical protein
MTPLTPRADIASCVTGSLRCPRAASCWRWTKPAAPRQSYAEFAGGDDCADFVEGQA